ncbi:ral guanine nucleotide dissociation stimulator-like 1 [Stegostoma tigrinum]|uniref:ral guanine nucleotide dissociation stimulator-like 1 n=1 Tax=Stegostoma tigrinum TaxID=3053191 RepID=UPI00287092C1|nr:ral guanine nucleotide dissociation stimulator-like 1 [Stegostoma tigrinum]
MVKMGNCIHVMMPTFTNKPSPHDNRVHGDEVENSRFDDTSPFSFLRLQPTLILKDLTVVSGQSACRSSQISVILLRIKMASGDELPSHLAVDTSNVQILHSETSKRLVENFVIALMNKERFYIRTFFSTYKAYTTAESVLYILLDKYGSFGTSEAEEIPVIDSVSTNSGNSDNIPSCEELANPVPAETVTEIRKSKTFDSPNSEKDEEPSSPKATAEISNFGNVDSANGEENGSCGSSGSSEIIAKSKTFDSPNSDKVEEPSSPKATAEISNSGNVDSANGEENGSCGSSGSSEIIAKKEEGTIQNNFDLEEVQLQKEQEGVCSNCESIESEHCPNSDEIQNLSSPEKGATVKKSIDFNRSSFLEEYNFSPPEKETLMKIAIPEILEIWLEESAEDFRQVPTYSCLRKVLCYLNQTVPGSDAEHRAQKLLSRFLVEETAEKEMFKGYRRRVRFYIGEEHDQTIEQVDEKLLSYPSRFIAEQLTFMDADLFRKLVPSQCLGSIWSQRGKEEKQHLVSTVQATITQFNNVTKCVTSTILRPQQLKPRQRAKIIEKWIDVAQECRTLQNFSSVHAITTALQSNSVFNLKKTWAAVSKSSKITFEDLSNNEEDNFMASRELLMEDIVQGIVPYLGTFLTEFSALDSAFPNYHSNGLINFDKRQKEYEIILGIKSLQFACSSYTLRPNENFLDLFFLQQYLSEDSEYVTGIVGVCSSSELEKPPKPKKSVFKRLSCLFSKRGVKIHNTQTKSSEQRASLQNEDSDNSITAANILSDSSHLEMEEPSTSQKALEKSLRSVDTASSGGLSNSGASAKPNYDTAKSGRRAGLGSCWCATRRRDNRQNEKSCLIRVRLEEDRAQEFKTILVTNQDRVSEVLNKAITALKFEPERPQQFALAQIIESNKVLILPADAILYYAMNKKVSHDFILRFTERRSSCLCKF